VGVRRYGDDHKSAVTFIKVIGNRFKDEYTGDMDGIVMERNSGLLRTFRPPPMWRKPVTTVAVYNDMILIGDKEGYVKFMRISDRSQLAILKLFQGSVSSLVVNSKYVVGGSVSGAVVVYRRPDFERLFHIKKRNQEIMFMKFLDDDNLVTFCADGNFDTFDLTNYEQPGVTESTKEEMEKKIRDIMELLKNPSTNLSTYEDNKNSSKVVTYDMLPEKIRENNPSCAITLEEFKDKDKVAWLRCNHVFDAKAYQRYGGKCPLCRAYPGVVKKLSFEDMVILKILQKWENEINETRKQFLTNIAKPSLTVWQMYDYAKEHKNKIIFQNFPDKEKRAFQEVAGWFLLSDRDTESSNKRARTTVNLQDIPLIKFKKPLF
jgi:hypothetical protein